MKVGEAEFTYFSLREAERNGLAGVSRLPFSMKVLLENLLRNEDGQTVTREDIEAVRDWLTDKGSAGKEIAYRPARVLMQDFTGVPAVVDLAAMRDAMVSLGGDPEKINPLVPVDLVIDHSVIVDEYGTPVAFAHNVAKEYERNGERYRFLKWGQQAFENFRVVPPGTGICHQVNLEYLGQAVWTKEEDGNLTAYPDTCVGTDSHTTMINGLGVLGWGVGGIEAEAAMLGQPISMLLPEVIGFRLTGKLKEGVTATDLVLTVTQMLRRKGVVGKFVEFFGPGLSNMTLADRATIGNMSPEYGATCGFFPVDSETLNYMTMTGREQERIALVEAYCRDQGMWREANTAEPVFTDTLELDLGEVVPSMAGPKRPEGRIPLEEIGSGFAKAMETEYKKSADIDRRYPVEGADYELGHGDVAIAAITSCTNTSNPSVLIGAGLLARNALKKGLKTKPWVKTSLAPGSQVVAEYLRKSGLQEDLDKLGFNLVGFGCTTCIGNSGPLNAPISKVINDKGLIVAGVLSGNRNFEGRISPDVQANYLASPPLVVAHALAGTVRKDLTSEPLGEDQGGNPVYLKDIWPTTQEIQEFILKFVTRDIFAEKYADVFKGDENWQKVQAPAGQTYAWDGEFDLCAEPALFHRHGQDAEAGGGHQGSAHPRPLRRQDHDGPHLARGLHQGAVAGRFLSHGSRGAGGRLQPVRHAARQSRGDDARHLRQYPHPQPHDGPERARGRLHDPLSVARGDVDLRRGHEVQAGRRAARHLRRRGVRQRFVAGLGGEGHEPARRSRRHRRILRAHPPLQPGRHGCHPLRARGPGCELGEPRAEGRRDGGDRRAGDDQTAREDRGQGDLR